MSVVNGRGLDEAVWYHLQYGVENAGFGAFTRLYWSAGIAWLLSAGMTLFLILKAPLKRSLQTSPFTRLPNWIVGLLWTLAFACHPISIASYKLFAPKQASLPAIRYFAPYTELSNAPAKKPNLVWIYGESLERSYLDESVFPGLMPNIKAIASESLDFGNIAQVYGTGWTIAGMVSSQCGIPLVTTGGGGNTLGGVTNFLPGAVCLGDILHDQGYQLAYVGGASLLFAGKGQFYRSHSFDDVIGYDQLAPMVDQKTDLNDWGLHDDVLFGFVRQKIRSLLDTEQPFALFTLTLGTHHPQGYVAKECAGRQYQDGSNPMLNAVHCADYLIGQLVRDIRAMDRDNSTLIVVGSDHLAMTNSASDQLAKVNRTNLLLYNWPEHIKSEKSPRLASTLSSGVTALHLMGFPMEKLAFGRSLIGEKKSLLEELPEFNDLLASWEKDLRNLFWVMPHHTSDIIINPTIKSLLIGSQAYALPLVVQQEKNSDDLKIIFEDPEMPLSQVACQTGKQMRSLWIDSCDRIKKEVPSEEHADGTWCVWDNLSNGIKSLHDTVTLKI
jgi:phosphoglycerol transferase